MQKQVNNIVPIRRPFLLELDSERFMDLVRALHSNGFQISNTRVINRYRIEDVKKDSK